MTVAALPTPQEVYAVSQYQYPLFEDLPIVRIPVLGPPPFNMLAYVRTLVGIDFGWEHNDTYRATLTCPTALFARGFDPTGDAIPVVHSSTAVLRMMQNTDDGEFQYAVDAVHRQSRFDSYGRWNVTIDRADREEGGGITSAMFEISSWVMFREPAAVPGAPPAPEVGSSSQHAFGTNALDLYKQYLASPRANVLKAAAELTSISGQLAVPPTFIDGVAPQQLALDALTSFTPAPEDRLGHLLAINESRHNLIVRLRDAQMFPAAAALAETAVAGYREYAVQPGADLVKVWHDMADLVKPLIVVGAIRQALTSARDAHQTLMRIVPEPGGELDHEVLLAEAQHNVVARLLDNHLADEATTLANRTIRAYTVYAGRPGANRTRAVDDLERFSTEVLAPGGLADLAAEATAAAAALE